MYVIFVLKHIARCNMLLYFLMVGRTSFTRSASQILVATFYSLVSFFFCVWRLPFVALCSRQNHIFSEFVSRIIVSMTGTAGICAKIPFQPITHSHTAVCNYNFQLVVWNTVFNLAEWLNGSQQFNNLTLILFLAIST